MEQERTFKTSGAASSSRTQVTKLARKSFGGGDLPECFRKAALTVAHHWLLVRQRDASVVGWNKYGSGSTVEKSS
eukprot:3053619-Prymnesium_polylepis.2